ncbi:helix-turn-helix domain-containing protein [Leuconostoc suionicum]|uniref:helix-turn-helix domain-containing protein n=1 Tax=Leuconostoc suionicum TaxID=1511761 RepID=UPI003C4290FE
MNNYGFFVIFNGFLDDGHLKKISGGALKLYVFLGIKSKNDTGESFYTVKQMADYFDVSTRSISNWIKELEKINLVERIQLEYNGVAHTFLNTYNPGLKKRNEKSN